MRGSVTGDLALPPRVPPPTPKLKKCLLHNNQHCMLHLLHRSTSPVVDTAQGPPALRASLGSAACISSHTAVSRLVKADQMALLVNACPDSQAIFRAFSRVVLRDRAQALGEGLNKTLVKCLFMSSMETSTNNVGSTESCRHCQVRNGQGDQRWACTADAICKAYRHATVRGQRRHEAHSYFSTV